MPNKYLLFFQLMRLHSPTGYLLVFFPTTFGLLLAANELGKPIEIKLLILFFIGSVVTRGAGCIINDFLDQNYDRRVARTRGRPLASNKISNYEAIILLGVLLTICLGILLTLTNAAIIIGFVAFFMMISYPLVKRFSYFPQFFLGFTFNLGSLIAYATVSHTITLTALIIYLACCSWTVGYDTIYGFMDAACDRRAGIKSNSLRLMERNYKFHLTSYYVLFILGYLTANLAVTWEELFSHKVFIIILAAGVSAIIITWQLKTLDIYDSNNCLIRFKVNNYIGLALALAMCGTHLLGTIY